jgi:hypothetical protein
VRFVGDSGRKNNIQIFSLGDCANQGQADAREVAEGIITDLITIKIIMRDADCVINLLMPTGYVMFQQV